MMEQWTQERLLNNHSWYHTTSNRFCLSILSKGIIADINKETELDFGYGFYLTPSLKWSKKYADGFSDPRIIEFHFKPRDLIDAGYSFKYFGKLNEEFADFVFANRMFFAESPSFCIHNYDFVFGVMSDGNQPLDFEEFRQGFITKKELYRRICLPKEDWQLMIHSQSICDTIKPVLIHDLSGGVFYAQDYLKAYEGTGNAFLGHQS